MHTLRYNVEWLMDWAPRQQLIRRTSGGMWAWRVFDDYLAFARVVGEDCNLDNAADAWREASTTQNSGGSTGSAAATARIVSVRQPHDEDDFYQYLQLPASPVPSETRGRSRVAGIAVPETASFRQPCDNDHAKDQRHGRDDSYDGEDRMLSVGADESRAFYARCDDKQPDEDVVDNVFSDFWAPQQQPSYPQLRNNNNQLPSANHLQVPEIIQSNQSHDNPSRLAQFPKVEESSTPQANLNPRAAPYANAPPPVPPVQHQHAVQQHDANLQPYRQQQTSDLLLVLLPPRPTQVYTQTAAGRGPMPPPSSHQQLLAGAHHHPHQATPQTQARTRRHDRLPTPRSRATSTPTRSGSVTLPHNPSLSNRRRRLPPPSLPTPKSTQTPSIIDVSIRNPSLASPNHHPSPPLQSLAPYKHKSRTSWTRTGTTRRPKE